MANKTEVTVEERLRALYDLQLIDSRIDEIRNVRGELPLEVRDLEDEVAGLNTRLEKLVDSLETIDAEINARKNLIEESKTLIKKYAEQQKNVRNNREYDALTKEIEFQNLEIELAEKHINEFNANLENKKEINESSITKLDEIRKEWELKKSELAEITAETRKEEEGLAIESAKAEEVIEERLLTAYKRLRDNARNGLAVVPVERSACGGCFNKIPPQRQLDINSHKKVIVCEHCGRILIDPKMAGIEEVVEEVKPKRRSTRVKKD